MSIFARILRLEDLHCMLTIFFTVHFPLAETLMAKHTPEFRVLSLELGLNHVAAFGNLSARPSMASTKKNNVLVTSSLLLNIFPVFCISLVLVFVCVTF